MHEHIMDGHAHASCNRSSSSLTDNQTGRGLGCRRLRVLFWEELRRHARYAQTTAAPAWSRGRRGAKMPPAGIAAHATEPRCRSLSIMREGWPCIQQDSLAIPCMTRLSSHACVLNFGRWDKRKRCSTVALVRTPAAFWTGSGWNIVLKGNFRAISK